MVEVHDNGGGATMDHMDLERERGITITSAATSVEWGRHTINLIDTPGHVDFTVEVERSLRVLDGAVLVLCAVGGVQAQSLTVDRQMKRYHVPRLAFINKLDRAGADPLGVRDQVREKLTCDAVLLQLPIGLGESFEGVVDLISQQAIFFDGERGEDVRREAIPASMRREAAAARAEMLEALAMYSDELMELLLSEMDVPESLVQQVLRDAVQSLELTPVLMGSAYRNKGVQPLLDAVTRYLPSPLERQIRALGHGSDTPVELRPDPDRPVVAMAFKIVEDPFGQLTFLRIYQGTVRKGQTLFNQRTGRKERFSRLVRMHADKREEVKTATAGDIVAVVGIDASSGDTYAQEPKSCTLESMFVPDPVLKVAVRPLERSGGDKLNKALARFRKEDPTFRVLSDEENGEILIAGMGELHLEVYVERIRREYHVAIEVGAPKVSYREAPSVSTTFDHRHRKQTGGAGQYAHIVGRLELLPADATEPFVFEEHVVGGRIPRQFIPSIEKGFREALRQGPIAKYPVVGVNAIVDDGSYHEVDSSDRAFLICARDAFREAFKRTRPMLLEPIMKLDVECPEQFQGAVIGDLTSRRGLIRASEVRNGVAVIAAEVPLAETFGYATDLRSMTQGQGVFSMELSQYRKVPPAVQEEIATERKQSQLVGSP
jgi:elongation factor G